MSEPSVPRRFLIARFWRGASGFWRARDTLAARLLVAVLVAAIVLQLALQYRLNYWSRDFFDAFGRRDSAVLWAEGLLFPLLAGLSILVTVLSTWARMAVQREWRAWLTRHLLDRWLHNDRCRQLHFLESEDENPEYRIAEDVRVATDAPVGMASGLLMALASAVTFIGVLWNVGGDLPLTVFGSALIVPKYLVLGVVLYSVFLTLAMMIVGRRMIHVMAGKNAAEAEFRSVASKLRELGAPERAERGGLVPPRSLSGAFDALIGRWRDLCVQMMRTTVVSYGNSLAAPVIAWMLCAPKYLTGTGSGSV